MSTEPPPAENPADDAPLELVPETPEPERLTPPTEGEPEASADADAEKAKEARQGPTASDRKKEIKELQKTVKTLDGKIDEEKAVIAKELVTQPPFEGGRETLLAPLQEAREVWAERSGLAAQLEQMEQTFAALDEAGKQKKAEEAARKEQHTLISSRYVEVGRAAYETWLQNPALQEPLAETFADIVKLDATIAEKKKEAEALEEQKQSGFLGKIKGTLGGMMVRIPTEADRDKVFAGVGGKVLVKDDVRGALGNEAVNQVASELAEPIAKIREIDGRIAGLDEKGRELNARLQELKGEAQSPKARLSELKKVVGDYDKKIAALSPAISDAYLSPETETVGRTAELDAALGRLKQVLVQRTQTRTQISKLDAENRIEEIVGEREKILQKRHKLMQEIQEMDRRLGDLHEQHVRLHAFVTKVAQGAVVELGDEEAKEEIKAVAPARLEAGQVTNSLARARFTVTQANGSTLVMEMFGGEGILFGRSHLDQGRNLRNDWVCRAMPQDSPDASMRTRRISKVHGGLRAGSQSPGWFLADWSTAGLTLDNAPVEKNGWIQLPREPSVINLAGGAVIVTAYAYPGESLVLARPEDEGRWYSIVQRTLGIAVEDGRFTTAAPAEGSPADFAILFRDGQFGVAPRPNRPDITLNGQPLSSPQLLSNGAQIACEGCSFAVELLGVEEPAI